LGAIRFFICQFKQWTSLKIPRVILNLFQDLICIQEIAEDPENAELDSVSGRSL